MNDHATSFLFGVEQSVSGASWIAPKKAKENLKDLFKQEFDLTEAMSELLVNRNFNIEELSNFFDPKIKNLMPDPLVLKDMDKTINRLLKAILDKETIGIFGDYDVDGACSSAIIYSYLIKLGCKVEVHIPDRFTEGYGPNTQALMKLKEQGCNLIITVDCGITAFEPLKKANEENIDIIIIDHHITEPNLPEAYSIINPNRFDEESKLGYLSAAGVCFLTLVALDRKLRENNIKSNVDLKLYLDLVALATICDVVPLRFLNRAFVSTGLKVMGWRQNHGLKALFDLSNLREIPNEQNLGYIIGPRINAAGRLGNSNLGVQLLCCNSEVEASVIADKLNQLNEKRKDMAIAAYLSRNEDMEKLDEKIAGLVKKSKQTGIPYGILKKSYDRGMAAWRTGHRPGTTPQQWAFARINSFLTGGGARKADADLWSKAKGAKKKKESYEIGQDYANHTYEIDPYSAPKKKATKESIQEWYENEEVHDKYRERYGERWIVKLTETYDKMMEKVPCCEECEDLFDLSLIHI